MLRKIAYILATGFGSGYAPLIPGTAGSIAALIIFLIFPHYLPLQLSIIIVAYLIGVWAAGIVAHERGEDPGLVVIDEFAGQWLALILIPQTITAYTGAFILFRIFDILKPFPVRQAERLPAGWGIMTDDILAGVYANIILQIIIFLV